MTGRRKFLAVSAAGAAMLAGRPLLGWSANPVLGPASLPSGTLEESLLAALPGKVPLIKKSWRPPNFETPVSYFNDVFTPNNAFFVRYHLATIPEVAPQDWRLRVGGEAATQPFELTLGQLRSEFEPVEIAAVCQCSGNRRGLSDPHVPGVEWGYGAMGNARWKGARLKDVLARAGLRKDALEIAVDGADGPVLDKTPDFIKSIPIWKAMDEATLLAYEMNGEALPHWNGYPVRLIVPGWTATYWMKHLVSIEAVSQPYGGFWMDRAYRIPKGKFPVVDRFLSQETSTNTPITEMVVNSLVTNITEGQRFNANQTIDVKGIAWDGGYGVTSVEVSQDGGRSWLSAELGPDHGRYSFRQWRFVIPFARPGTYTIMVKATNRIGATQTADLNFNPAGYHNNVMQSVKIQVG